MSKKSNCCNAELIDETDLCSQCKEHCEVIEEIEIWYRSGYFYVWLNDERHITREIKKMEQFAKFLMPDLLWGDELTVLQSLKENGGEYSTAVDNSNDIKEYLEANFEE